nr:MAG TPA: intron associated endonuclease [Caudoviricetes sp.]
MKKAIYKITNNITNKSYIGQSVCPERRFKEHYWKGKYNNSPIDLAMQKYGLENFSLTILEWCEDYNEKEKYYIQYYNTLAPNGYNLLEGGDEPPHKYGEDHPNSKYKQEKIEQIITDLQSKKFTLKQIQDKYNVPEHLVSSINRGATHRKNGIQYPIITNSLYHLSDKDFDDIVYLLKNSTCTCSEIGAYFGKTANAIKAINSGRNHYCNKLTYPIRNFRGKANSQSVETILAKRSTEAIDTSSEM